MLKKHYDKVIALLLLAFLLGALIIAGIQVGGRSQREAEAEKKITELNAPDDSGATVLNDYVFTQALDRVENPFLAPVWTNAALTIPETMAFCVHANCTKIIPVGQAKCSCGYIQETVIDVGKDTDGDGLTDLEEAKLGLNPLDKTDANKDNDGDGFTNYDEFKAGFEIDDPASHPPKIVLLRVKEINVVPFPLVFKSFIGKGEKMEFWFDDSATTKSPRGKLNQPLSTHPDVKVIEFIPEAERRPRKNMPGFDVIPAVVVKSGDREIKLFRNRRAAADDIKVTLVLPLDGKEFRDLKKEDEFDFDNRRYRLIRIDTADRIVVLRCLTDKSETTVRELEK